MSERKLYLVKGYLPMQGQSTRGYIASSEAAVMAAVKAIPPENGGFVNYTIEEVELFPEELNIACPSCPAEFPHPGLVTDVSG